MYVSNFFYLQLLFFSGFMGLWLRFDMDITHIPKELLGCLKRYNVLNIVCTITIFYTFKLYSILWKSAGIREGIRIIQAGCLASLIQVAGMAMLELKMPRSFFCIYAVILIGSELLLKSFYRCSYFPIELKKRKRENRCMIVGAGKAGTMVMKEIVTSREVTGSVCCFVDDDKNKQGKYLNGIPVYGGRLEIPKLVERLNIKTILIAVPSIPASERKEIIEICQSTKCYIKILPGMYQLMNGDVISCQLREIQIEDLLEREPIQIKLDEVMKDVSGKVILVTGGGGSIGSELCRQIADYSPRLLIILDIYENNAYAIQQELKREKPNLNLLVLIGSVRNTSRIDSIFEQYKPDIVYHAAAHKHVPLMEESPNEAIKNNVFGTYKTALAAAKYGTKRFILISTDKAVNPTNIMGASKRICEMIIQMMNRNYKTEYVAVRFGNVLGSNGSVIPLFKRQIAEGGPVTVTHPEIVRYFMTIPEAVALVLQAGVYAKGGELFVLDMGKPVKIHDLAKKMIELSGFKPNVDIVIKFTGLRPGEKLYEELLMYEEGLQKTNNKLIYIGKPIEFDDDKLKKQLEILYFAATQDDEKIKDIVQEIVPTYVVC